MKYTKDYYQILGIKSNATATEIRRAYRHLAILYHPDRNPSPQSNAQMQEINEAYSVIGNQNSRAEYDVQHPNFFTESPTQNRYSYDKKKPSPRAQYPFQWESAEFVGITREILNLLSFGLSPKLSSIYSHFRHSVPWYVIPSSIFFVITLAILIFMNVRSVFMKTTEGDVIYFTEETSFIVKNPHISPIDISFSGLSSVINVEKYGLTIRSITSQSTIGVVNLPQSSLPSDLFVIGSPEYSNLSFDFTKNIRGFGFAIFNETKDGYSGISNFMVTLKQDGRTVGTLPFSTPADGVVFVGFVSRTPFNTIILMEAEGGPEEQFGCCPDQETFGKFYIVP